jgi:hypothetical protein
MTITNERMGLRDRGKASERSIKKITGKVRGVIRQATPKIRGNKQVVLLRIGEFSTGER